MPTTLLSSYPSLGDWDADPTTLGAAGFEAEAATPTHPGSRALIRYCEAVRGTDDVLRRGAIHIRNIPALLPFLFIAEPHGDDWRFRLYGTALTKRVNHEFTWKTLREIFEPDTAGMIGRLYDSVARRREIRTGTGRYLGLGLEHAHCEVVHIPMRAQQGDVVHILGGVFFFN